MFISCPEISIFLVKTTCETASDKLVPSLQFVPDSSTVPRYILVRENIPVRGLGVDIYNAGDWGRVRVCSKIGSGFFSISSEISATSYPGFSLCGRGLKRTLAKAVKIIHNLWIILSRGMYEQGGAFYRLFCCFSVLMEL